MPYVLTVDQIGSQHRTDAVAEAIAAVSAEVRPAAGPTLPFTRTVGDEFQGLLPDAVSVLGVILTLMRTQQWHIGLGIGPVDLPLASRAPEARGAAFVAARQAVEQAKQHSSHLRVVAAHDPEQAAVDVESVLHLLGALWDRRTASGWAAVDRIRAGDSHAAAAERLRVSRQAVDQRLQAAHWHAEEGVLPTLARLLSRAERLA